jgi:RNA polymerase sigma factor (sigma-70 family)
MSAAPAHAPGAAAPAPAIDIRDHVRLVKWTLAKRYRFRARVAVDQDDLYAVGLAALHRAAQTFDPTRGSFATYALPWLRARLNRELMDHGSIVRVPVHKLEARSKRGERWWPAVASLNAPLRGQQDGGIPATLEDLIPSDAPSPDADLERQDAKRQVAALIERAGLSARERRVVMLRVSEHSHEDISPEFGITREAVRQIEVRALAKLRQAAGSEARGSIADFAGRSSSAA